MQTQAYFNNIQSEVLSFLSEAQESLWVAVAWFTDRELLTKLCEQAQKGLQVQVLLMEDEINQNPEYGLDFSELEAVGGKVFWIPSSSEQLMHNKFVVSDQQSVLTGSYNWSNRAKSNHENITITQESPELAQQFIQEFQRIRQSYDPNTPAPPDYAQIFKRVEILGKTIAMADTEDIAYQSQKLQKILPEYLGKDLSVLGEVQSLLREQSYARATALIQDFIQDFSRLATYEDPEIPALKLEIRMLEIRLSSLQDEQSDLEKLIRTFQIRHDQELGELVLQILELRKKKAQAEAQAEPENKEKQEQKQEAESDYEQFHQEYKTHKKKKIQNLDAEEQQELKKLYRQATKICHPDMVAEEDKEKAQALFTELDAAYKEQDLKRVREIHENLQKGIFETQSKRIHEKQKLYALLKDLEQKIEQITQTLQEIQASGTLQKIQSIEDWDAYFVETKGILEEELEDLKTDAF